MISDLKRKFEEMHVDCGRIFDEEELSLEEEGEQSSGRMDKCLADKIRVLMSPDYANALFWDEEGCCIGGYDTIWLGEDNNEIDLSSVIGLKEWFIDWDNETLYQTNHWTDSQWREWWAKGLEFAKAVNELLPNNVELSISP